LLGSVSNGFEASPNGIKSVESGAGGAVIKVPPRAGTVNTNYSSGSGSVTLDFSIEIVLGVLATKMAKTRIIPRKKVLKTKKVIFKVSHKTICKKKEIQRFLPKC
jgi:hypothetical protein